MGILEKYKITKEATTDDFCEELQNSLKKYGNPFNYIWSRKRDDISQKEFIFIPALISQHWMLFVVTNFNKFYGAILDHVKSGNLSTNDIDTNETLTCFSIDSINKTLDYFSNCVKHFITFLLINLLNYDLKTELPFDPHLIKDHQFKVIQLSVPTQNNGYDCGICMLENIEVSILHQQSFLDELDPDKCEFYPIRMFQWKRQKMAEMIMQLKNNKPFEVS